jgi:hypothetical protein
LKKRHYQDLHPGLFRRKDWILGPSLKEPLQRFLKLFYSAQLFALNDFNPSADELTAGGYFPYHQIVGTLEARQSSVFLI